jgi:hypothetical protein
MTQSSKKTLELAASSTCLISIAYPECENSSESNGRLDCHAVFCRCEARSFRTAPTRMMAFQRSISPKKASAIVGRSRLSRRSTERKRGDFTCGLTRTSRLASPAEPLFRPNLHNQAELLRHAANATLDRRSLAIERKTSATCITFAGSISHNGRRTEPPSKPRRFIAALVVCG